MESKHRRPYAQAPTDWHRTHRSPVVLLHGFDDVKAIPPYLICSLITVFTCHFTDLCWNKTSDEGKAPHFLALRSAQRMSEPFHDEGGSDRESHHEGLLGPFRAIHMRQLPQGWTIRCGLLWDHRGVSVGGP